MSGIHGRSRRPGKNGAKFLPPSHGLKAKAPLTNRDLAAAVEDGNAALAGLQKSYAELLDAECRALNSAFAEVEQTGGSPDAVAVLMRRAREIRGHSGSVGLREVCEVCDSLSAYLESQESLPEKGIEVARVHLEALALVLQGSDEACGPKSFDVMAEELRRLTAKAGDD